LLDSPICKVKIITIKPGESPSYQYHFKREEHWVIVKGSGVLLLNNERSSVKEGENVFIAKEDKHTIINNGKEDLIFIETQLGEYFGEDDIVRLDDKYGRI
jgi:mannose-6-phosphate isomerase-like protein (cupin superfamily)